MQTLMPFCPLASAESSWAESTRSLWASWAIAEVGRTVRAWDKMSRTPPRWERSGTPPDVWQLPSRESLSVRAAPVLLGAGALFSR